jgi:endothelin-converting enzyme
VPFLPTSTSRPPEEESNFRKLKTAYNACLNIELIKRINSNPLDRVPSQIRDTFPTEDRKSLNSWSKSTNSSAFRNTIVFLQTLGIDSLISPRPDPDEREPDVVAIHIVPPVSIGLPAVEHYTDLKILKKYRAVVSEVMSSFVQKAKYSDFDAIVDLEIGLAQHLPNMEDERNVTVRTNLLYYD